MHIRLFPRPSAVLCALAVLAALLLVTTGARAQMSETERKAAARAAYQEGVRLQDEGKFADALMRFESAEKLYDAPTHLLHMAECQALTGRLVEASETYELLARKTLPAGSPEAFTQAQQQGQAELSALRTRIPSLRVTVKPGPQQLQGLQVNINGVHMPNELLGIARPLNPGTYRLSAQAVGWSTPAPIDIPLGEKEQKSVELTLQQTAGGAAPVGVVAPPPLVAPAVAPPPPYGGNIDRPKTRAESGPTSAGLLLGLHGGGVIPAGEIVKDVKAESFASAGGGGGIDIYARVAKVLLLGATLDYASLGAPKTVSGLTGNFSANASTTYAGVNLGILPNVDKVSFIGDVGLGSRSASLKLTGASAATTEQSLSGLEFALGAGLSIPAGPIRIVPKTSIGVGSFSSSKVNGTSQEIVSTNRATHAFVFIGLALFYSLDFGSKPEPD